MGETLVSCASCGLLETRGEAFTLETFLCSGPSLFCSMASQSHLSATILQHHALRFLLTVSELGMQVESV